MSPWTVLVFISVQFPILPTETEFRHDKNNRAFVSLSLEKAFVTQDDPQAMQCYYLNVYIVAAFFYISLLSTAVKDLDRVTFIEYFITFSTENTWKS